MPSFQGSKLKRQFAAGFAVFLVVAIVLVWNMGRAMRVVEWMNIYRIEDFKSFGDAFPWIADLRIPIPPNLALLEISEYRLLGSTDISTGLLYKAYVLTAYSCVLLLAYPSRLRFVISGLLGWLFIFATKLIHPGNPMLYDATAPALFMLFVLLLKVGSEAQRNRNAITLLVFAGVALSMLDLTRPYIVLLLPFILVFAYFRIASLRRFAYFLIPIVIISGTWHTHLAVAHRQMTSSNHFGVNMWRCWNSKVPPLAKPVKEDDAQLAEGRWPNLNNPQHLKNSLRLRKKIVRYILDHPGDALQFMAKRVWIFTKGETAIYVHKPSHLLLAVYSPVVRMTSLWMIIGFFAFVIGFGWLVATRRSRLRAYLGDVDNLILFVGFASIFILATGEIEEEARMVISVLPLLAAMPHVHRLAEIPWSRLLQHVRIDRIAKLRPRARGPDLDAKP